MNLTQTSHRRSEQGFTLVELAIVMVIIGLLIGGILKGQELIANARISASVSQLKGIDAALNTFQDKYNSLPGDITTPSTRLPNCAAGTRCGTVGTGGTIGNGRIEGGSTNTAPTAGEESGIAYVHLNAADLLSGINQNGGATFGGQFLTTRVGGGLYTAYASAAPQGTTLPVGRHYTVMAGVPTGNNTNDTGAFNATVAAQIDRKLDDGVPQAGSVQTRGTGCFTGNAAASVYAEANNAGTCTTFVRALN